MSPSSKRLGGTIDAQELGERLAAENQSTESARSLRIYDATIAFGATDKGPTAEPGIEGYRAGHIPGAQFVDHQADLSDADSSARFTMLSPARLEEALQSIGICSDSSIVIYSTQHVMWATRLWWILHSCGLTDIAVLDGGFEAWLSAGRPTSKEATQYPRGNLKVSYSPELWADKDEVLASIGSGSVCTINALSQSNHRGTSKTHYGRPGHIKGSVNVPFQEFLEDGRLLSESALRATLEKRGAFERSRTLTYCGGGIAATLAAFALHQLGHPNVAVYDGSLSEWGADPALPMETSSASEPTT